MADDLLAQSAATRAAFFHNYDKLLTQLVDEGQHPRALFIGCADSRVTPEALLGLQPGDFFVVRNVANIVPAYIQADAATAAALEYAVQSLAVPHIIVCGHSDCGGIKALDAQVDISRYPALSRWIELARPAQREVDRTAQQRTAVARHAAIVERNVVAQMENVASYPFVREAQAAGKLELHGWVYDLGERHVRFYDAAQGRFVVA